MGIDGIDGREGSINIINNQKAKSNKREIEKFLSDGHMSVAQNTCIIDNVKKITNRSDNMNLPVVNILKLS